MLKKSVTYEDFNGNTVTEDLYFNLTETELIEMEVGYEDGLGSMLERIVATKNRKALITEFKKLILAAYGEKSEDGKYFLKNDEIRTRFSQSAPYDTMFLQFAQDDNAAATFLLGIIPKSMRSGTEAAMKKDVPDLNTAAAAAATPPALPESYSPGAAS